MRDEFLDEFATVFGRIIDTAISRGDLRPGVDADQDPDMPVDPPPMDAGSPDIPVVDPAPYDAGSPGEITCYAESGDGVAWEKPRLGLEEFGGSRDNNLVRIETTGKVDADGLGDPCDQRVLVGAEKQLRM